MSDNIEASSEDEKQIKVKGRKIRSEKQMASFEKARKIRSENLRFKKEEKVKQTNSEPVKKPKRNDKIIPVEASEEKEEEIPKQQIKRIEKMKDMKEIPKKVLRKHKTKVVLHDDNSEGHSSSSEEYIIRRVKKNKSKAIIPQRFNPFDI